MKYERILLKMSGEVFAGETPIDFSKVTAAAAHIKTLHELGCKIGVVVGGGNILRGRSSGRMDRNRADSIGMLATAINSLALEQALIDLNVSARVLSAVEINTFMDFYSAREANRSVDGGTVVIFACGTGSPFFSTDTAAALRAAQIKADALLLAKNIDGVYTADPAADKNARRYTHVSYDEIIEKNLKATDLTAISFCREYNIPIIVFDMRNGENFVRAVNGESGEESGTGGNSGTGGTVIDGEAYSELA